MSFRGLGRVAAGAIAVAVLALTAPPAGASTATRTPDGWQTEAEVWGINDPLMYWNLSLDELAPRIEAAHRLGARWVRFAPNWPRIQASGPGTFRWDELDLMVGRLAAHGLRWRPTTLDVPNWMHPAPTVDARQPPASPEPVAEFVDALLDRYGPDGEFWDRYWWLEPRPVEDLELHNEPNARYFWGYDESGTSYRTDFTGEAWARLYGPALDRLAAEHPEVRFWMGGLVAPAPIQGAAAVTFIRNAFAAHPSLSETLAGVAMHTYPFSGEPGVWSDPAIGSNSVAAVAAAAELYGGPEMQVQVNEFGGSMTQISDEENRVAIVNEIADLVRSDCPIAGIAPYASITHEMDPANPEHWFGLIEKSTGEPYPAGEAYAEKATGYTAGTEQGAALDTCSSGAPDVPGAQW